MKYADIKLISASFFRLDKFSNLLKMLAIALKIGSCEGSKPLCSV